jgi:peptidoglycan/LPS O-acetylase OafA/YrhL
MAKAKSVAGDKPGDLAQRLEDPAFREQIEQAIQNMPPEKAAELVAMLEVSLRRRKIELVGYLGAALVLLLGMIGALYYYGTSDHGDFVGWVFLLPLGAAGAIMMLVGRWADRGRKDRKARVRQ